MLWTVVVVDPTYYRNDLMAAGTMSHKDGHGYRHIGP